MYQEGGGGGGAVPAHGVCSSLIRFGSLPWLWPCARPVLVSHSVLVLRSSAGSWVALGPTTFMRLTQAPVLVMYNHHRYWHVVFIVGYNDDMDNGNCAYTETFRTRIAALVGEMEQRANEGAAPAAKQWYKHVAAFTKTYQAKLERAYATGGGCTSNRGVFYIRDSIYPDPSGPVYHYDPARPQHDARYSKKIVFKEFDWLRYFANHITVVYPKGR